MVVVGMAGFGSFGCITSGGILGDGEETTIGGMYCDDCASSDI